MSISRIYRLLQLITMLQRSSRYTVDELARELGVSRRTVFRDLNMLEMAHIPYHFDPEQGGYRIGRHFFLPPINLTLTEALAILMMAGKMRGAGKIPLLNQGAKAAMKVESALPQHIRKHVGSILDNLKVSMGPMSRHEDLDTIFDDLTAAIEDRKVCKLVYVSFQEKKQIITHVHPLRLVFMSKAWYLLGYSSEHLELRTFKLGRIRKLIVTDRIFEKRDDGDLDEYFGMAWQMIPEGKLYDIHLHFDEKVAGNVAEVIWHKSQKIEWNDDGSIEFHVTVDGIGEISWWIIGYGNQVEVISPAPLRKRIAEMAVGMLKKYS